MWRGLPSGLWVDMEAESVQGDTARRDQEASSPHWVHVLPSTPVLLVPPQWGCEAWRHSRCSATSRGSEGRPGWADSGPPLTPLRHAPLSRTRLTVRWRSAGGGQREWAWGGGLEMQNFSPKAGRSAGRAKPGAPTWNPSTRGLQIRSGSSRLRVRPRYFPSRKVKPKRTYNIRTR